MLLLWRNWRAVCRQWHKHFIPTGAPLKPDKHSLAGLQHNCVFVNYESLRYGFMMSTPTVHVQVYQTSRYRRRAEYSNVNT